MFVDVENAIEKINSHLADQIRAIGIPLSYTNNFIFTTRKTSLYTTLMIFFIHRYNFSKSCSNIVSVATLN